ncbi:MAG: hypothetical protein U0Y10_01790 [Spirosomataceae bacterium]
MKTLWFVFTLWSGLALAQDRLEQLRQERQQLVFEWKSITERNSGLFGSKSKDDLEAEISALQQIIKKDEQIQDELSRVAERVQLADKQHYNELLRQNNDLNSRIKELQDLISRHKQWSKENHSSLEQKDIVQQVLWVLLVVLLVVSIALWQKYKSAQAALKKAQGWK